jgi:septal ring-binding cell division protein DamX
MLEGEISEIRLVERLVELWREQFTGAIRFENDGIIKIVYFKGGDILSASTNDRADSIDEILMKAGKVSREHVKQALAKRKESETLGDALLNLGFITRKELTWARRVQVVGVIRSINAWTTGSFTIVADYLPKRDEGTLFPLPQVIVELIVTEQDRQQFERAMDGGSATFAKAGDFDEVFRRLGLNEDAEAIAKQIDGTQSASEIATSSGRDAFNAYKLLQALATLGIITRAGKPQVQPQFSLDDFSAAGVSDAADLWSEPQAAPAPGPMFQIDEAEAIRQPTLEIPVEPMDFDIEAGPAVAAPTPAKSAWDETEEVPTPVAAPAAPQSKMPSWDKPAPAPIPAHVEPPAAAAEEWGFDEAQIETARRATSSASSTKSGPKLTAAFKKEARVKEGKGSRFGLIITVLVIAILAAGGYYGWLWWQARQAEESAPVAVARPAAPKGTPPPATSSTASTDTTMTMVPITSSTDTGIAVTPPGTSTASTATVAPAPEPSETAALPRVTPAAAPPAAPANASRERYDALAREYAANPSGNFTIQIQILCDTGNLGQAIKAGGSNIWFVPQPIGARSCYRVMWGHYTTREEAQRALATVPAALRDRSASVKPVPR